MFLTTIVIILMAYIFGSISSAILVCRISGLPDPRKNGSGNPGATNVLRIGNMKAAITVLMFDLLKGMIPVYSASNFNMAPIWLNFVVIATYVGHVWPIFFRFKGGKGVATAFGAITPIGWDLFVIMISTWLITVLLSGYSSLGAITSTLATFFYVLWFQPQLVFPVLIISCLILLRHISNIKRLLYHKEIKIWIKLKNKNKI